MRRGGEQRVLSDSQASLRALAEREGKDSSELVTGVREELVRLRGEGRLVVFTVGWWGMSWQTGQREGPRAWTREGGVGVLTG